MNKGRIGFALVLILTAAVIGAVVSTILAKLVGFGGLEMAITSSHPLAAEEPADSLIFDPPKPEDAPAEIRDAVMLGYRILTDTQKYAAEYVGNELNCTNCHFDGGRAEKTLSLVGVAAKYPRYRKRQQYSTDLVTRTNGCFQRSQNGKPLPPDSKEMQAIMAYYHWISKGIPIYADVPWLGLKKIESDHKPDKGAGREVFALKCVQCHGQEGQGTLIAPPLWGPGSFNDGAGMSHLPKFAAFGHLYMPKGKPDLTIRQSLDVAAFVTSQPRPKFE